MRSLEEILFRLRQETANLWLLFRQPSSHHVKLSRLPFFPDPQTAAARLRGSQYAKDVEELANEALQHRFRLLGLPPIDAGDRIAWRRDLQHGTETGTRYFRFIPYLDFKRVGDHKVIWELNRHQHLVLLAQAFLLTQRKEFLKEIQQQLDSWMEANPFQRGINWASALEVAFRAISWMWILHFVGERLDPVFREGLLRCLLQHGRHIEYNLSIYFSPNTHLLGEAVALHALGTMFSDMPQAARWRQTGGDLVLEQMERQVRPDGSHFEQSSYYHLYALDFFLLHALLRPGIGPGYMEKLAAMAEYLDALVSSKGILALLGDEDGGRLFHPYGDRRRFAGATLATCAALLHKWRWLRDESDMAVQAAWWLKANPVATAPEAAPCSRRFADSGLTVLRSTKARVLVRTGGFAPGTAGHSHADALSIVVFLDGDELLIDPGTFTYAVQPDRDRFRSAAAHNTIWIEGVEQALADGPFRWQSPPDVQLLYWDSCTSVDVVDAVCRYRGFTHRRTIVFRKPDILVVLDRVSGLRGVFTMEQHWLCPATQNPSFLAADPPAFCEAAERSSAFGSIEPAVRWKTQKRGPLPAALAAVIGFGRAPEFSTLTESASGILVQYGGGAVRFLENAAPDIIG